RGFDDQHTFAKRFSATFDVLRVDSVLFFGFDEREHALFELHRSFIFPLSFPDEFCVRRDIENLSAQVGR
ncbi:MAG: hypothetical protein GY824_26140, partial [Delftia sp.]|nr:hypothetical protein [Delftia sp.]